MLGHGDTVSPEVNLVLDLLQTDTEPQGTGEFMSSEGKASGSGYHILQDKCPGTEQQYYLFKVKI